MPVMVSPTGTLANEKLAQDDEGTIVEGPAKGGVTSALGDVQSTIIIAALAMDDAVCAAPLLQSGECVRASR